MNIKKKETKKQKKHWYITKRHWQIGLRQANGIGTQKDEIKSKTKILKHKTSDFIFVYPSTFTDARPSNSGTQQQREPISLSLTYTRTHTQKEII